MDHAGGTGARDRTLLPYRWLVTTLLGALTGATLAACASEPAASPAPTATPTPAPVATTSAPATTTAKPAPPPGPQQCDVTLTMSSGSTSTSGTGAVNLSTTPDGLSISCEGRETLEARIDPDTALVLSYQGERTSVGAERSRTVGPYEIRVTSVKGATAQFLMVPTGS